MIASSCRILAVLLAALVLGPAQAGAQAPAPAPQPAPEPAMMPREPLPAPPGVRPFPTPSEVQEREITLEEAVRIALENQPQIQARIGDYQAAQQRIWQALSPQLPQVSGQWGATEQQTVASVLSPASQPVPLSLQRSVTVSTTSLSTSATVTASQLLWDFGKTLAATDAARANARSSLEDVEIQKDEIARLVKEAYFNLLFRQRLVAVRRAALDRAELNLRSARGFFEVGTRPKSDVTRAEVDVANARVDLIRALNDVSLTRVTLNTLMGIAVNAPTKVKDILAYRQYPMDRDTLVAEAFQKRPEYRQAKARVEASEATVKQTFRDFFPSINANGTYGAARADMNEIWSFGVSLSWSLFDGGNRIARYKEAQASVRAAQARLRDVELRIWQEVEQAYLNLLEAEERIGAAEKAVESAQENFRLAQGRFDAGVANIIELTDAQLALTNAQAQAAQSLADYGVAVARLERALGRR
jgi:outer membrane protein